MQESKIIRIILPSVSLIVKMLDNTIHIYLYNIVSLEHNFIYLSIYLSNYIHIYLSIYQTI